jgi:hypothetical protein
VDPPTGHVDVLRHRYPRVPEVIRTDARGQPLVINQCGNGLAEAVCAHARRAQLITGLTLLPAEIARVAQRARGRREDDCLLAEVRQPPTRPQHVDGEARQRYRSPAGQIDARYYWLPTGEQTPRDGSYRMAPASGAVRQIGVSSQQHAARY